MKVTVRQGEIQKTRDEALVVNLFQGAKPGGATGAVDKALGGTLLRAINSGDFMGEKNRTVVLYPDGRFPARRVLLVGLGKKKDFDLDVARQVAGTAARKLQGLGVESATTVLHGAGSGGLDVDAAAAGMFRVINANMAHGVRDITVKVGLDPREFPMVVAGGAGALHACMIANELEMPRLLVPPTASVLCAAGMLLSDLQHDYVRSYVSRLADIDLDALRGLVTEMIGEGDGQLALEGVPDERIERQVALDLRYLKQYHEVTVAVPMDAIQSGDRATIAESFHAEHNRLYGYDLAGGGMGIELINVRLRAIGRTEKPDLPELEAGPAAPDAARKGSRRAYAPETARFVDMPVFDGHALAAGNRFGGPALIERTDTTILVTESFTAEIDRHGSCLLTRRGS